MILKIQDLILGSSNQNKIKEYLSFGLDLKTQAIPDLREVNGSAMDVIIYKVLELNQDHVILEDTSLEVDGAEIGVNAKWLMMELRTNPSFNGRKAYWNVYLGVKIGDKLSIMLSTIHGTIDQSRAENTAFGFDSVFVPDGTDKTLYELKILNQKHLFSARKKAIDKLIKNEIDLEFEVSLIPTWKGNYQQE